MADKETENTENAEQVSEGKGTETESTQDRPSKTISVEELERLSREYGGWRHLAEKLQSDLDKVKTDNFKYREQRRKDRDRLKELEDQVADGVILKGDEAKEYESLKKLGKKPEEIESELSNGRSAIERLAILEQEKTLSEAARLLEMRPTALGRFVKADNLDVEIDEQKENDEIKRVPVVVIKSDDENKEAERMPLAKYAESHWSDDLDALKESRQDKSKRPSVDSRVPKESDGDLGKALDRRFGKL